MLYKVGDKVRVRKKFPKFKYLYHMLNEDGTKASEHNSVTSEMEMRAGEVVIILEISGGQYRIDNTCFHWTDEMFEGLVIDAEPTPDASRKLDWELENLF